ncbi:hypothetical protein H5410_040116 [Solanum commersonii]|uniref:Saposin-like type B region 1 domain-containing protein n=1 Tax=Solanum commersonii TaxID=4109 RepID=A0A9J5XP61_SOLCO|nr:hypothetical protein H5410_040116 [Solanum commersonii]
MKLKNINLDGFLLRKSRALFACFSQSEMTPTVCQLQLHLDGQQFVSFKNNQTIDQILNNPMIKKTMLTEFFLMNKMNNDAINLNLLYKEFLQHFVWSSSYKMWSRRKQRLTIGRIVTCHPTEGERYYLRLLLMNIRGPKSYEALRTVDGKCYTTFREAAEKKGLLHSDNNLIDGMSEAVSYQMPYSLRRLFAILLVYCNPEEIESLNLLFNVTYPDFHTFYSNPSFITSRIILTTKNDFVDEINDMLIHRFPNDATVYTAIDETIEPNDQCQFEDFLHTLHPANLPPYRLTLKKLSRCIFQIDLSDGTATTTTSISAELGEKLLSMTAKDIFDITCAKNRSAGLHDHMCFACEIAVIWMDNQLTESKTEDRILHYLNKIVNLLLSHSEILLLYLIIHKELIAHKWLQHEHGRKNSTIWLTLFPTNMVLRLNIDQIESATRDWICKVQIVEIGRPRESLDKKCTFQNLILEDEKECQIKAVMYADEIQQYADKLKLNNTYLISIARVKVSPTSYGKPIHQFYWILDKETVIEQIKPSNEVENPLPPPTKLNITGFNHIPHLMVDSTAEIDILAIVLRCGPQKNAGRSHYRCREITLCDNQKKQFLFTLWEDFGEIEGHEISSKMATEADLPVILGRSIGISTYQGLSLQTRYNSTVRVNPNYPQALALINWAKENKTMLLSYASDKTSTSSSVAPIIVTPAAQQLISIAEISSAPSMGVFYVKAEMVILDEFQDFCVLECSGCKQKKCTKDRKDFECPKCNRKTALRQSLSLNHVHEMLSNKVFEIHLRKSSWGSSNTTHATLYVLSYMEKQHTPQSTTDRTSKKIKPLEISEVEVMATTIAAGSSNPMPKFEPPTPTKKM